MNITPICYGCLNELTINDLYAWNLQTHFYTKETFPYRFCMHCRLGKRFAWICIDCHRLTPFCIPRTTFQQQLMIGYESICLECLDKLEGTDSSFLDKKVEEVTKWMEIDSTDNNVKAKERLFLSDDEIILSDEEE